MLATIITREIKVILHTVACHHGSPPQRHRPSVLKIQYCVRFTRDLICYAAATREPVSQQNNGRVGRGDQQLTTPNPRPQGPVTGARKDLDHCIHAGNLNASIFHPQGEDTMQT